MAQINAKLGINSVVLFFVTQAAFGQATVEEIVVTAQKREQSLQEVGISVTALSGREMRDFGFSNVIDVIAKVPGIDNYSPFGPGSSANIVIRGIGLNDFGAGHEAPITTYVDEFYLVSVPAVDFALFDLDRVEVLRGPQGTLFGRNSTGGLVHFVTAKPTKELTGFVSLGGGRFGEIKAEAAVSGPLSDNISARLSLISHHSDGYTENLNPDLDKAGEAGTDAIRGQLLFEPGDSWRILLKGEYFDVSKRHTYYEPIPLAIDPATGLASLDPDGTDGAGYNARNFGAGEPNVTLTSDPQKLEQDGFHALARIEKDIGDLTVTSLTGYFELDRKLVEDCDASPNVICAADFPYETDWFTQELRLDKTGGDLQWTAGLYYLHQEAENHPDAFFNVPVSGPGAVDPVTGLYNGAFFPIALAANWEQDTDSFAVFGQIDYKFAPQWSFIAGLRWTHDEKDFVDSDNATLRSCPGFPIPSNCFLPPVGTGIPNPFVGDYEDDLFSWRLQLNYQATDDLLLFGSVSQGSKAGGFNNGFYSPAATDTSLIPYDDETNIAYEIGAKSEWLDRRLRINGSAFYYDYSDFQTFNWLGIGGLMVNRDASAFGGELELDAFITDNLNVRLGLSYLDTTIEDVTGPRSNFIADREMANAPDTTVSGAVVYNLPLTGNYNVRLQWDFNYVSERFTNNFNDPASEIDSYFKHNALVTFGFGENWELQGYVRNISDERYVFRMFVFADLGYGQFIYAEPRTYGGQLIYSF